MYTQNLVRITLKKCKWFDYLYHRCSFKVHNLYRRTPCFENQQTFKILSVT